MEDLVLNDKLLWGFQSFHVQEGGVPSPQISEWQREVLQWGESLIGDGTGGWGTIEVVPASRKTFRVLSMDAWRVVLDFYIGLGKLVRWSRPKYLDTAPNYDYYLCPYHLFFC